MIVRLGASACDSHARNSESLCHHPKADLRSQRSDVWDNYGKASKREAREFQ